jgi:hypothetical protein
MNLSGVNQIREIKTEFLSNTEPETRKRALYALGNFSSEDSKKSNSSHRSSSGSPLAPDIMKTDLDLLKNLERQMS